jgi:hypothetical protein
MGNNSSGLAGKRRAQDIMGIAYAEADEEKDYTM